LSQYFDITELGTSEAWIDYCVDLLSSTANKCIAERGRFNIAVSGGTTPADVFSKWIWNEGMSPLWSKTWFYWVDERVVPHDSAESNYGNAMSILKGVPANFRPMYDGGDEPTNAASIYEKTLNELETVDKLPFFDLVLLGMGDDGHTASLFPDSPALQEDVKWVVANPVSKSNTIRLTLTYPVLLNANEVFILFNGHKKRQLLNEMMKSKKGYPIERIQDRPKAPKWIFY